MVGKPTLNNKERKWISQDNQWRMGKRQKSLLEKIPNNGWQNSRTPSEERKEIKFHRNRKRKSKIEERNWENQIPNDFQAKLS